MISQGQLENTDLKNILLKLEELKSIVRQHNCVTHNCHISEKICDTLSQRTNKITSLPDSIDLKYYKLCEEIAVVYFQLKNIEQEQIDHNILEIFFTCFKTEITQSDHYLYQVSQNMIMA